jgi:hypothetical protein
MKNFRSLKSVLVIQVAIIPAFIISAFAQQAGSNHPSPIQDRAMINDDTFRELMKVERENTTSSVARPDLARAAVLKQLRDDFKSIQDVNNKMMAEAWAREQLDYGHISDMLSEINGRATRLKANLLLPEPESSKKKDERLSISGPKGLRSALLLMDRSIMSFVTNPIFQKPNVMEIGLAKQARRDLESVIALSVDLKKVAANLKTSAESNH